MEMIDRVVAFVDGQVEMMLRNIPRKNTTPPWIGTRPAPNIYRCLARIIVWDNTVYTLSYVAFFSIIYWFITWWGFGSCVAACSAASTAIPLATYKAAPDEADNEDEEVNDEEVNDEVVDGDVALTRGTNGRVLPQPRDLTLEDVRMERNLITLVTMFYDKLKLLCYNKIMQERDNPMKFCIELFLIVILAFIIQVNVSYSMSVYLACLLMIGAPGVVFLLPVTDIEKESDTEIEEFVFAVTEDNFKVLNRAGETGDHSPTPPSLDTSATNDFFAEELPGFMPSHTRVVTEDVFRTVEEMLELNLSSVPLLGESRLDGSSSSEDEEISLKPKKITEVNVEDDDDSSDELNDFEIIEAEEIADINNGNDV